MAVATEDSQHITALKRANHFRITVARECKRIATLPNGDGIEAVARIIEDCEDEALMSGRLSKYLGAPTGVGPKKVTRLMAQLEIRRADKKLRELTGRQREVIAEAIRNGYRLTSNGWLNRG
jgi:hypothetical protein